MTILFGTWGALAACVAFHPAMMFPKLDLAGCILESEFPFTMQVFEADGSPNRDSLNHGEVIYTEPRGEPLLVRNKDLGIVSGTYRTGVVLFPGSLPRHPKEVFDGGLCAVY